MTEFPYVIKRRKFPRYLVGGIHGDFLWGKLPNALRIASVIHGGEIGRQLRQPCEVAFYHQEVAGHAR